MVVWEQVKAETTTPHISYAVTGFALILFGTISLFLKEKLYIGEATVATIYGLIVGPHCLSWFTPTTWGNTDYITLEISRIVLIVQIFAVAVELPKKYMLRHWWSVTMLLLPVMIFGWLISSVFIWKLVPTLRWLDALCIAGCVTATDPVLASAVVGKGKFARRVPGHLRNLLSAESGCNDGMAYPFVILAVYILKYEHNAPEIAKEFICVGVLYSCVLGILIGAVIGYGARHLIKFAERWNLIDRESFLVYYFCVALFCAGVGTLCGVDDLLVAFAAGSAFSWDGWFSKQTEESHVSNVIDVLINTAFFVYFGAIVPWPEFNNHDIGITAWKLVCVALIILVVRRIPIMLAIKPITPDIHTWREALFSGHFGPIGVGAIFMCLLARAQIESSSETPLPDLVPENDPHYYLVACLWPVTCFLVISSIIVHGSSVAVFTLGQRINNMAITLTYTTGGNEPSWMSRLPRRSTEGGNILQLQRMDTEEPFGFKRKGKLKRRASRLRRRRSSAATERPDEATFSVGRPDNATVSEDHDNTSDHRRIPSHVQPDDASHHGHNEDNEHQKSTSVVDLLLRIDMSDGTHVERSQTVSADKLEGKEFSDINAYREGRKVVIEDDEGNFIHEFDIGDGKDKIEGKPQLEIVVPDRADVERRKRADQRRETAMSDQTLEDETKDKDPGDSRSGTDTSYETDVNATESVHSEKLQQQQQQSRGQRPRRRSIPRLGRTKSTLEIPHSRRRAYAYMVDNMVFVENDEGDILRRYKYVPRGTSPSHGKSNTNLWSSARKFFSGFSGGKHDKGETQEPEKFEDVENAPEALLVPVENESPLTASSTVMSAEDETLVRRRLSKMLRSGEIDRRGSRRNSELALPLGSQRAHTVQSQAITTDGEASGSDDDDEAEPETAVERNRRLAALGIIPTDANDEEEDDGLGRSADNNGQGEDEPKITFKLPERRHD